jgi:2-iminobutanoate/2-iminopropanoate deaminase
VSRAGDPTQIEADGAPEAVGPYSQAVRHGDVLYCSDALPIDPRSGQLVLDSPAAETDRCLRNLAAVCVAGETDLSRAIRMTIYTTELASFTEINDAYARFFPGSPPARVAIGVSQLPKGARVEIDAIVAVC